MLWPSRNSCILIFYFISVFKGLGHFYGRAVTLNNCCTAGSLSKRTDQVIRLHRCLVFFLCPVSWPVCLFDRGWGYMRRFTHTHGAVRWTEARFKTKNRQLEGNCCDIINIKACTHDCIYEALACKDQKTLTAYQSTLFAFICLALQLRPCTVLDLLHPDPSEHTHTHAHTQKLLCHHVMSLHSF